MHLIIVACATDEFYNEKCDILKKMRKKSTLNKISSVLCFLKSTRPV